MDGWCFSTESARQTPEERQVRIRMWEWECGKQQGQRPKVRVVSVLQATCVLVYGRRRRVRRSTNGPSGACWGTCQAADRCPQEQSVLFSRSPAAFNGPKRACKQTSSGRAFMLACRHWCSGRNLKGPAVGWMSTLCRALRTPARPCPSICVAIERKGCCSVFLPIRRGKGTYAVPSIAP